MGSLAYAAGGALAGGGQGAAAVGKEDLQEVVQSNLERLRNDYANQRQQTAIAAQQGLQQQAETFQHGETEEAAARAVAAAGATRNFQAEQDRLLRESREKIGAGHDAARVDAAYIETYLRSLNTTGGKNGGIKPFQSKTLPPNPADPKSRPTPYTYDPNTGQSYVQAGNKFYRMGPNGEPIDGRNGQPYDPKATRRSNPDGNDPRDPTPDELELLARTPYARVPAAAPGAGLTYVQAFEKEYGYIPSDLLGTVNRLSQQQGPQGQTQSQSISLKLPSGRTAVIQPPPPGMSYGGGAGGGGNTGANPQDLKDDSDDEAEAQ
jgi:hypothetical protein